MKPTKEQLQEIAFKVRHGRELTDKEESIAIAEDVFCAEQIRQEGV